VKTFDVNTLVIERQTALNPVCFALMYAFCTAFKSKDGGKLDVNEPKVIIADPLDKFRKLKVKPDTTHKRHKKLSSDLVKQFMSPEQLEKYATFKKQDDIADAVLQAITLKL
jgi:hypothetical protein